MQLDAALITLDHRKIEVESTEYASLCVGIIEQIVEPWMDKDPREMSVRVTLPDGSFKFVPLIKVEEPIPA